MSFIRTTNYHRFMAGMAILEDRGAQECNFLVLTGEPGLGKTTTLSRWAAEHECTYLCAESDWTVAALFQAALTRFGITTVPHRRVDRNKMCKEQLQRRAANAARDRRRYALIIDEANHVSRHSELIEKLRDWTDQVGVTCVLVGTPEVRDHLTRFDRVSSRVAAYVDFFPMDINDLRQFAEQLCPAPIASCLLEVILQQTRGYSREVLEALKSVSRFSQRQRDDVPMTVALMAGERLLYDRKTGQPIQVPEAF